MNVVIVGLGDFASALARRLSLGGHEVVLTGADPSTARGVGINLREWARVAEPAIAARAADIVIVTTSPASQLDALRSLGDLTGKTVVDVSNPPRAATGRVSFDQPSRAEELARALPGIHVVKAFNTLSPRELARRAGLPVFYAGDHPPAKTAVHLLIESIALLAVDAGPLVSARHLEPMAALVGYVREDDALASE